MATKAQPKKREEQPATEPEHNGSSKQLIPTVEGTALEVYGNREMLRELVDRLMSFHPAANEVGPVGMRQAAQLAILMGASPLPATNEIHIWTQGQKIMVMPGINYWRRRSIYYGGLWWVIEPRPMDGQESLSYDIAQNEHGAICRAVRQLDVDQFLAKGIPWQAAIKAKSQTGLGTVKKGDTAKNGRPIVWTAIKRAETDLLRQLFPYQPGETFEPGAGLLQADDGAFEMDVSDREWGGLDLSLDDDSFTDAEYTIEEVNEQFGLGDQGEGHRPSEPEEEETIEITYKGANHDVPKSVVAQGSKAINDYLAAYGEEDE